MSEPEDFQQQLNDLRRAYLKKLPARISQIESLWVAACEGSCSQEDLNTLYEAVHQLNGSGAAFGLAEVTASTHYLDSVVKNLLLHDRAPTPAERVKVLIELSVLKVFAVDLDTASPAVSSDSSIELRLEDSDLDGVFGDHEEAHADHAPTILIADDEAFLRTKIALSLRAEGFAVLEVNNGLKALDKARKHHPDVILMDVMMPLMDGLEATQLIREAESLQGIPIIIMTVHNRAEDVKRAFVCGITDYIVKPFRQDHLIERIKACLKRAESVGAR